MKKWTNWSAHFAWGALLTAALLSLEMQPYWAAVLVGAFWLVWETGGHWLFKWPEADVDLIVGWLGVAAAIIWMACL